MRKRRRRDESDDRSYSFFFATMSSIDVGISHTCFSFLSVSKLGGKRISLSLILASILALSITVAKGAWHISKKMIPRLYKSTFCEW